MNKDTLLQVSEIVSHAGCPDGIGAAMICTAAYSIGGMSPPPTHFVQYDTKQHSDLVARPKQLFADITPPKDRWEEWRGLSPVVLDHHETVAHVVSGLGGVYGSQDESGSMLAYSHVMLPLVGDKMSQGDLEAWKRFSHLCMTRDTWKTASPDWPEACALASALLLYGQKWSVLAASSGQLPMEELLSIGRRVYDKTIRQAKSIARSSIKFDVLMENKTVRVAFFNHSGGGQLSDIAHYIMEEDSCDVVVGYFYAHEDGDMRAVVSIRNNGCFSAANVAESFGGGGHGKAAGFRILGDLSPGGIMKMVVDRMQKLNP